MGNSYVSTNSQFAMVHDLGELRIAHEYLYYPVIQHALSLTENVSNGRLECCPKGTHSLLNLSLTKSVWAFDESMMDANKKYAGMKYFRILYEQF